MKISIIFLFSLNFVWASETNSSELLTPKPQPVPSTAPTFAPTQPVSVKQAVTAPDFQREVRAILESSCISCHGSESQKGGLRLDTLAFALEGGDSGPALTLGKKSESLILERIHLPVDDDEIMPPKNGPLSKNQKDILNRWIATGAEWPKGIQLREISERELSLRQKSFSKKLISLNPYPASITLTTKEDFNSIILVATYSDDVTRDITFESAMWIENTSVANLQDRVIYPKQDGATKLIAEFHGQKIEIPIKVETASSPRPVSFKLDVMPVFMKAGCNTGSCHGSARGQDRFMLSLFGYDPDGDHYRITREQGTRRINLAIPEESMLVEKAIGAVPHSGGKLFSKGSDHWNTLVDWLKDGANKDPEDIAKPTKIELFPPSLLLEGNGSTQQMTVLASYSDGTTRDITPLTVFQSSNDVSAAIDEKGLVTAGSRGEAFVMARFNIFTVGVPFVVIPEDLKYTRPNLPTNNYVDTHVHNKLHKLRMTPSEVCSDEVFVRRLYLDVIGLLPTAEETSVFLKDQNPSKRSKLIDKLLEKKEFTELWVMKFAELLQIQTDDNQGMSYKATLLYFNWLKDRIANNVPMDKIVKELLTSKGGTFTNPATNYYQVERDNLKITENVAQVFMGMRLQCAQCHNHPFDRWTQDEYYSFASFFSQVGRKGAADPRENVIYNRRSGEINHPVHKKPMPPKFLGGETPEIQKGEDRRQVLAEWLASPKNPYFARNLSNLVWAHFFGQGIIEPVDDVRVSNPPSNPELIDQLSAKFTEYNYDFKKLVRDVCNSRIYQLSSKTNLSNESDTRNFARAHLRRLRAEVMLDVISQTTETKNKFQGLPLGAKAIQIADGRVSNYFLTTFGRAKRATVCSCEVVMEPSLSQALHLLNGDTTNKRVSQGKIIVKSLKDGKKADEIIDNLFLRCYSRKPRESEKANLLASLDMEKPQEGLEDIFWALLNSKEFIFNH